MFPLSNLPPNADPFQLIFSAIRQYPWIAAMAGVLLAANILMWLFKPEKKRRKR